MPCPYPRSSVPIKPKLIRLVGEANLSPTFAFAKRRLIFFAPLR